MSWIVGVMTVVGYVVGLYVGRWAVRRDASNAGRRSVHVVFQTVDGMFLTREVQFDLVTIFDFTSPITRVTIVSPSARSIDDHVPETDLPNPGERTT